MADIRVTETDTEIRAEARGHSESVFDELMEAIKDYEDEVHSRYIDA